MKIWVIKCSGDRADGASWEWASYFGGSEDYPDTSAPFEFGGAGWVRSPRSMRFLRDEVSAGDLAVCYHTKGRAIHGLARLHSRGMEAEVGSGEYNQFDLAPADEAFALERPLRVVEDLYAGGCRPACFRPGSRGTVWPVAPRDFDGIVAVMMAHSPQRRDGLRRWLEKAGYRRPSRGAKR
jgi:hypothetical protein